jgi:asparagine synthase (glutamine-hydrolysing)
LEQVFEDFSIKTRRTPIVVMLSGGYDSRLIAALLKKFGRSDVTCVSYGLLDNAESIVAQEVAKRLGFSYQFFEYTFEKWDELFQDAAFDEYLEFSHNYTSIPHLQDYLAIRGLRKSMSPQTLVLAGHAGDFLGGSHLSTQLRKASSLDDVLTAFYDKLYLLRAGNMPHALRQKILDYLRGRANAWNLRQADQRAITSLFEFFDWRERQAKLIANSVRVYDHFSLAWALPFWDIRLVDFWNKVDLGYRVHKKLYDDVAREIFQEFDLNFDSSAKALFGLKKNTKELLQYVLRNDQIFHMAFRYYRNLSRSETDPQGMGSAFPRIIGRSSGRAYKTVARLLSASGMNARGYDPNSYVTDYTCSRFIEELTDNGTRQN